MWDSLRYTPSEVEKAKQKLLQNYCGAVLEELEESLEQAIMSGKLDDLGELMHNNLIVHHNWMNSGTCSHDLHYSCSLSES
jgi:hypothetical protein